MNSLIKVLYQTVIDDSVATKSMSDIWRVASQQDSTKPRSPAGRECLRNSTGVGFPAIPYAIDRADKRLLRIQRFQLASQVLDMAVDGSVGNDTVIVIEMIEQLFTGEHFSRLM